MVMRIIIGGSSRAASRRGARLVTSILGAR
jgi:hypothetical protein